MNLTELLATPVIDLSNATRMGVVSAFAIGEDLRHVVGIVVLDEDDYCHEKTYRMEDAKWGQDCVLLDAEAIDEVPQKIPLRGQIYDLDGVDHGYLKEVVCNRRGRITAWVNTEDVVIAPTRVWRMGELLLLKGKRRHRKAAETTTDPAVTIEKAQNDTAIEPVENTAMAKAEDNAMAIVENAVSEAASISETIEESTVENEAMADSGEKGATESATPKQEGLRRIAGDYSFLLGRTIRSDLVREGETILSQGRVIDEETIALARENGVLLTLTELSR